MIAAMLLFLVTVPAAGASGAGSSDPAPSGPPQLKMEQEQIDLGEVRRGQVVEATFVIRNAGGDTLRILEAKPG